MRRSSVEASSGDRDPFNPMSHCVRSSLVHRNDAENDGEDADNDDDDVTLSDDDVKPSLEDEDLHILHHTHASSHKLREFAIETPQAECDNEIETQQNEEELNNG